MASGAYTSDFNPSVVFVFDSSDKFGAVRGIDGRWKTKSLTVGDVAGDWSLVTDAGKVDDLLKAARTSLSEAPIRAK